MLLVIPLRMSHMDVFPNFYIAMSVVLLKQGSVFAISLSLKLSSHVMLCSAMLWWGVLFYSASALVGISHVTPDVTIFIAASSCTYF